MMRREPQQGRGKKTVEHILDTVAAMLESLSPEAITTNAIAERAGISIGTLYQYFPDKDRLFAQLTRRFGNALLELFKTTLADEAMPIPELAEKLIRGGLAINESLPGLKRIIMNPNLSMAAAAEGESVNQELTSIMARALIDRSGGRLDPQRAGLIAYTTSQLFKALYMSRAEIPALKDLLFEEYKGLIVRYWVDSVS